MILRHRRLFTLSFLLILSVFLIQTLPHAAKSVLLFLLLGALLPAFILAVRRRWARSLALLLLLVLIATLSSLGISHRREILSLYDGQSGSFSVTVFSVTQAGEDGSTAEGELVLSHGGSILRAKVKISAPISIAAGDVLYGEGRFTQSEADSYDAAKGLYGKIRFSDCRVTDRVTRPEILFGNMRGCLAARIRGIFPDRNGELLCALLLGEREGLPADFNRDMTRIGTTHMLSLSGLHLMVLTAGLGLLLRPLCLGKRTRFLILTLFSLFFMLLTGLSPSVMRACFMFLFSALPLFLREERDSLSSLAAAVALICLFEPYACFDISLWLSALSTLGILLLFDRWERKSEKKVSHHASFLRYLILSLSVTLAATVATLPLTLYAFGTIPLLSPLANLVLSPLAEAALYLGAAVMLLGNFPPLCAITSYICNAIFTISAKLGDIPNTVLSVREGALRVLILSFSGLVLAYFLLCPHGRFRLRVPVSLLLCGSLTVGGALFAERLSRGDDLALTLFSAEASRTDCLLLEYGTDTLLVPICDHSNAGYVLYDAMDAAGGELDALLLPFFSWDTPNMLSPLLKQYKVERLYLPTPEVIEYPLYEALLAIDAEAGSAVVTYPDEGAFFFEGLTVSKMRFYYDLYTKERDLSIELLYGYTRLQYHSANALRYEAYPQTLSADVLIFGAYGGVPRRHFDKESFVGEGAVILCPAVSAFPFSDATGVVFGWKRQVIVPQR